MSKFQKGGVTRIPKFGSSRIPITGCAATTVRSSKIAIQTESVKVDKETIHSRDEKEQRVVEDPVSGPYSILGIENQCLGNNKVFNLKYHACPDNPTNTFVINATYVEEKNNINIDNDDSYTGTYIVTDSLERRKTKPVVDSLINFGLTDEIVTQNKANRISATSMGSIATPPGDVLINTASTPLVKGGPNSLNCEDAPLNESSLGILSSSQKHTNLRDRKTASFESVYHESGHHDERLLKNIESISTSTSKNSISSSVAVKETSKIAKRRPKSFHREDASLDESSLGLLSSNQMDSNFAHSKTPSSEIVYDESGHDVCIALTDERFPVNMEGVGIPTSINITSTVMVKDTQSKTMKKRPKSFHREDASLDESSLGLLSSNQMDSNFADSKTPSSEIVHDESGHDVCVALTDERFPVNMEGVGIPTSINITSTVMVKDTQSKTMKKRPKSFHCEDASLDESLGILSSSQMNTNFFSENVNDESGPDVSLGIIDERFLSLNVSSNTTLNMELPLDSINNKLEVFDNQRLDQTPSPEDLPLDPVDTTKMDPSEATIFNPDLSEPKTDATKSKTISSFITSVTSITSLDTGYQGDGEMSRPASRGPDHSPLTRRPIPTYRPQPRRADPMTDSDFYTESDADYHEEANNPLRGDRRAQVIDGTLYGVDPQAAADIYVNNRENMDSSGVFTDLESNTRADDVLEENGMLQTTLDNSPNDSSSKTISDNSQGGLLINLETPVTNANMASPKVVLDTTFSNCDNAEIINSPHAKRSPATSITSSTGSIKFSKHLQSQNEPITRHAMPKRNVASKIKAMMELGPKNDPVSENNKRNQAKKPVGRWDNVMNKISKNTDSRTNWKQVKSKVFNSSPPPKTLPKRDPRSPVNRQPTQRNNNIRRMRARLDGVTTNERQESINSSLSDVSGSTPKKNVLGSSKKQREVAKVTQVLTATRNIQPQRNISQVDIKSKKSPVQSPKLNKEVKTQAKRKFVDHGNSKKPALAPTNTNNKECGRTAVKGGRVSPGSRPPQQSRATNVPTAKTAEALAVLVQHLVFNLEAFRGPTWKRQAERSRLEAEEARLSVRQLEETMNEVKRLHAESIEEERVRWRQDIAEVIERHRADMAEIQMKSGELERRLTTENLEIRDALQRDHENKLTTLKLEIDHLRNTNEQTVEMLREENDSVREEIDEKNELIEKLVQSSKFENDKLKTFENNEKKYQEDLAIANAEIMHLKEESKRIMESLKSSNKEEGFERVVAEVESLRAVLDLKQNEVSDLRKELAEATVKAEQLHTAEERITSLTARCEDLHLQLQRKCDLEQHLIGENKKLRENYKEEWNQKKRLSQYNEELQWKLKQNNEVFNRVLEQQSKSVEETTFSRSSLSSSFSERHCSSPARQILERTLSFREKNCPNKTSDSTRSRKSNRSLQFDMDEEVSPPSSPKVKGVVEKSDSVSYVLEMDESPEIVANRIVRRSFRNTTPPKSTPTKSPASKRPRMKNTPLTQSASASAIICKSDTIGETDSNNSDDSIFNWYTNMSKSCSTPKKQANAYKFDNNLDLDDDGEITIHLPALPSELENSKNPQHQTLPLQSSSGELLSDTNSDDDSNASSSSGHL